MLGNPRGVFLGLHFDARERGPFAFGFDHANGLSVDKEQIVRFAVPAFERKMPHGDTSSGIDVHRVAVLQHPARGAKRSIDLDSCGIFGTRHDGRTTLLQARGPIQAENASGTNGVGGENEAGWWMLVAPRLMPRSADVVGNCDVIGPIVRFMKCTAPLDERIDVGRTCTANDLGPGELESEVAKQQTEPNERTSLSDH